MRVRYVVKDMSMGVISYGPGHEHEHGGAGIGYTVRGMGTRACASRMGERGGVKERERRSGSVRGV